MSESEEADGEPIEEATDSALGVEKPEESSLMMGDLGDEGLARWSMPPE